jgi:hypothetical protein
MAGDSGKRPGRGRHVLLTFMPVSCVLYSLRSTKVGT